MQGEWIEWEQLTNFQKEILFGQNIRVVDGKTYVFVPKMIIGVVVDTDVPLIEIRFKQDE